MPSRALLGLAPRRRSFSRNTSTLRFPLCHPFRPRCRQATSPDAPEWKAYSLKLLGEEFGRQVYPDGFQYELATGYHGVVISNYLAIFELYEILGLERPEFIRRGLEKMYAAYVRLMAPDRRTPDLNDGGHVNVPQRSRQAMRLYPDRADFRWIGTDGREGAKPDVEVDLTPADIAAGRDPQLAAALDVLAAEVKARPAPPPLRYP